MLFRRFTARGEMRGRGERQLKRGEGERVHLYRYARDDDKLPRHLQCAMAVSKKNILGYTLVALTSYHQPSHAFVSRYPTCATANHQRRRGEAVLVSGGSKTALEQLRATPSSDSAALFSAKETQRAEIMEALFGATYDERIEKGRAAQGFLTTDALATRTLVPPRELTYGEYELDFFLSLVSECLSLRIGGDGTGSVSALESEARSLVFGDIGSGCGRLVVAQALTWPWRACRGVEIVPSLHDMGEASLTAAGRIAGGGATNISPEALGLLKTMAPCSLSLGDVNDEVDISDIDVLFCYSSSFPAFGDLLTEFSYTLGHKLRPGAQVITTDRRLVSDGPWEFTLLGEREGTNAETGGKSIAYMWQVVKSAL